MSVYPPPYEIVPIFEPEKFPLLDQTNSEISSLVNEYTQLSTEVATLGTNVGTLYTAAIPLLPAKNSSVLGTGDYVYYINLPALVVGGTYWIMAQMTFSCDVTGSDFVSIRGSVQTTSNTTLWSSYLYPRAGQDNIDVWTIQVSYVCTYTTALRLAIEAETTGGTWSLQQPTAIAQANIFGLAYPTNNLMIMRMQ